LAYGDEPAKITDVVDNSAQVEELPSKQDTAEGFLEGQTLTFTTRNFFSQEHTRGDTVFYIDKDGVEEPTHSRETWVQGSILAYSSGYTQGTVGFGVDVAGFSAVTLERGHGAIAGGGSRTLTDSDGDAPWTWGKVGIADARMRFSNTEVKVGRFQVDTPVLSYFDNRALPSSFDGASFVSDEVQNLTFQGGSIDRVSPRTGSNEEKLSTTYGDMVQGDRFGYVGATYKAAPSLALTAYAGNFQDIWNQYYLGATHTMGDPNEFALKTAFNWYDTKDAGTELAGPINNQAYSLAVTGTHQAHSLTLSAQQINGNEYFDYLNETASIYLTNSMFSDYNGPNETSFQVRYETDWGYFGVPGLSSMLWMVRGWGIDGTHYSGGDSGNYADVLDLDGAWHYEYGVQVGYKVQAGPIKDTSFKVSYIDHHAYDGQVDGNESELRLTTTMPFNLM